MNQFDRIIGCHTKTENTFCSIRTQNLYYETKLIIVTTFMTCEYQSFKSQTLNYIILKPGSHARS